MAGGERTPACLAAEAGRGETAAVQEVAAGQAIDTGKVAGNFVLLAAAEFIAKLATFVAFTYLGRVLGPALYGSLEFTLAVIIFFSLPVDLGLPVYGAREIAKNKGTAASLLRDITRLRILLSFASFLGVSVFAFLVDKPLEVKQLLVLYGLSQLALPFGFQWFFQGHDRMEFVAIASITRWGGFAFLVIFLVRHRSPLLLVGLSECLAMAAMAGLCILILKLRFGLSWRGQRAPVRVCLAHLRVALPIGLGELTWALLWYFATVVLGFLTSGETLGWFGAAHRALMALHTFVWLYFFNLLPSISRCVEQPVEELQSLMEKSIRIAAWSGFFVAFVISALAGELLTLAYGPAFRGGQTVLSILVWMLPLSLLSGHYRYTLIAYGFQKWLFYCTALSAALAVGLSFVLVPRFGALGASVGLLIAIAVEFVLSYVSVRYFVARVAFLRRMSGPLLALAACLAVFKIPALPGAWLPALTAALVYLLMLIVWERKRLPALFILLTARRPQALNEE